MASKAQVIPVSDGGLDQARLPTVFDVAREVGCSIATVSRALSQPSRVSPAIRQRIIEAVGRLAVTCPTARREP